MVQTKLRKTFSSCDALACPLVPLLSASPSSPPMCPLPSPHRATRFVSSLLISSAQNPPPCLPQSHALFVMCHPPPNLPPAPACSIMPKPHACACMHAEPPCFSALLVAGASDCRALHACPCMCLIVPAMVRSGAFNRSACNCSTCNFWKAANKAPAIAVPATAKRLMLCAAPSPPELDISFMPVHLRVLAEMHAHAVHDVLHHPYHTLGCWEQLPISCCGHALLRMASFEGDFLG
mmetsp:Transcript_2836/g.7408  ORF Transcript_2836/g.7408 Transcript_2836/m.7408 type:complete len:236 (+) Transcript_2836:2728-3435(+)